mmetsp:Transcript_24414/g.36558  ORF Transcript_24414/g.36558 Transcript_24414/m.36558 type:complete len:85 (-) Transcript_24414:2651-2905(-)
MVGKCIGVFAGYSKEKLTAGRSICGACFWCLCYVFMLCCALHVEVLDSTQIFGGSAATKKKATRAIDLHVTIHTTQHNTIQSIK